MDWLEQNIDAYRIVSEILGDMRRRIREGLETLYGDNWYRDGLPEAVFQRLVAAKERERSIDWYEGHYQQIMDYAVFSDLIEILEQNAEYFPALMALAPSSALLQARFLELDVMRSKLARARPISETELSFLGTFHLRFHKALADAPGPTEGRGPQSRPEPQVKRPSAADPRPSSGTTVPFPEKNAPEPSSRVSPPSSESGDESSAAPPKRRVPTAVGTMPDETGAPEASERAEAEAGQVSSSGSDFDGVVSEEDAPSSSTFDRGEDGGRHITTRKLAAALENDDHRTVLQELYREVTAIAEGVWSSDVTPAPLVWEEVTASDWYENNFSRLGLHPLSVFYEVTSNVEKMMRTGGTKKDLQELLKEMNFAKTLLALRDMFQANNL
jgi:hypothetical protein